jgi:hypothetical protein
LALQLLDGQRAGMTDTVLPSGLTVQATATHLIVSIGLNALAISAEQCPALWDGETDTPTVTVTDRMGWAQDVIHELEREEEDGTTPLHTLFDAAFVRAIEDGSLHAEMSEPPATPHGEG